MDDIENLFSLGDKPKNKTTPNGTVMEQRDKSPNAVQVMRQLYKHVDHNLDRDV